MAGGRFQNDPVAAGVPAADAVFDLAAAADFHGDGVVGVGRGEFRYDHHIAGRHGERCLRAFTVCKHAAVIGNPAHETQALGRRGGKSHLIAHVILSAIRGCIHPIGAAIRIPHSQGIVRFPEGGADGGRAGWHGEAYAGRGCAGQLVCCGGPARQLIAFVCLGGQGDHFACGMLA